MYNWYAVNDPRGLIQEGWKVPSDEDWSCLADFLGGKDAAGEKMKFTGFCANNYDRSGNGANESGFSGLPGGLRLANGSFNSVGYHGNWWSATERIATDDTTNAFYRQLTSINGLFFRNTVPKGLGQSVCCLRD